MTAASETRVASGARLLAGLDLHAERIGEAEHLRRAGGQRLEREEEDAGEDADHAADQEFDGDEPEGEDGVVAEGCARNPVDEERRQREGDRERDEEADLRGDLAVGEARREHETRADAAEEEKRADRGPGRESLRRAGERFSHQRSQEMVPSDFTSKPRAISSCDRMASVGNMRSTIMRT